MKTRRHKNQKYDYDLEAISQELLKGVTKREIATRYGWDYKSMCGFLNKRFNSKRATILFPKSPNYYVQNV